jgi:hypothetical protein
MRKLGGMISIFCLTTTSGTLENKRANQAQSQAKTLNILSARVFTVGLALALLILYMGCF